MLVVFIVLIFTFGTIKVLITLAYIEVFMEKFDSVIPVQML